MTLRAFIAASFFAVAGLCRAQGTAFTTGDGYSADGSPVVYQINLAARTVTPIGASGSINNGAILLLNGLTFRSDGNLYAVAGVYGLPPALVTLSRTLGKASLVSQIGGVPSTSAAGLSLAFSCDDRLWMASSDSGNFWELNPSTGQTRQVGTLGAKITGLAARGNVLYGVGGNGNANLYTIATDTGKATLIGAYGASASVPNPVDAAFDAGGALWGLIRNANDSGSSLPSQSNVLAQIDPIAGAMSVVGNIANPPSSLPFPRLRGMAIAPPSSCGDPPPPSNPTAGAPLLSPWGIGVLVLSLLATVSFVQRKRYVG